MALGQAAGVAASLSIEAGVPVRKVDVTQLQRTLLKQKAVLIYFSDVAPTDKHFEAAQHFGLRGLLPDWTARLDETVSAADADKWIAASGGRKPAGYAPGKMTRGELLNYLYQESLARQ